MRLLDFIFHKGYIITTKNADFDPNDFMPWQTWTRYAKGRTLVGVNEDDTDFATAGKTGGEKTHKLTESEMPSHVGHLYGNNGYLSGGTAKYYLSSNALSTYGSNARGWAVHSGGEAHPAGTNRGGSSAHNNMQPYITVYMWVRTA